MTKQFIENTIFARDGTPLFYRKSSRASGNKILVFHGLFEHSVNYPSHLERMLEGRQAEWLIPDLRGHGRSGGVRNLVEPQTLIQDTEDLIDSLGWPGNGIIGIGHSFGALPALALAQAKPWFFRALVLSSPFLGTEGKWSSLRIRLLEKLSFLFPKWRMPLVLKPERLTHNSERIRQYVNDPLMTPSLPLISLRSIRRMITSAVDFSSLTMPLLVLAAGDEQVVSKKAIDEWFERCHSPQKFKRDFARLRHEILNERENQEVYDEIKKFLGGILSA